MLQQAAIFLFKVRRKFARELRKRLTPALVARDLRCLGAAIRGTDARQLLGDYARLFEGSRPQSPGDWLSAAEAAAVVAQADLACSHQFDLLGSGPGEPAAEINWHADPKTGFQWPAGVHHLRIQWDQVPEGTDIKMPWELSRCQHFASLGLADRITNDGRYYAEFKAQVRHWIAANPCGFGVNWVCAMDVAIRAVNWLTASVLFRQRLEHDPDDGFHAALVSSLWLHGRHISRNLEWQGPRSPALANHFVADICGLLATGALFRKTAEGRRQLAFARRWFETEIRRQTNGDGANYETSTSYHRLAYEMFLWADTLAAKLGEPFSQDYHAALRGMASFVKAYSSPSGNAAQFGDNDSGRLLTAGIDHETDHRYLTAGECGFGGRVNRLLLRWDLPLPLPFPDGNGAFPESGYWFATVGSAWLGVRAGVVSHGGAHAHCDQLSFVLAVGGVDFIVDPGTGTYSASVGKRNRYRSIRAHTGCQLNHWEPNSFQDGKSGLFRLGDDTRTEVIEWEAADNSARLRARHHGYHRHRSGLISERSIVLRRDGLTVTDRLEPVEPGDQLRWSFPFAPGTVLERAPDGVIARLEGRALMVTADPPLEFMIEPSQVSPGYGIELAAPWLRLGTSISRAGNWTQEIRVRWAADSPPEEPHHHS